jgi:hypothetical protein
MGDDIRRLYELVGALAKECSDMSANTFRCERIDAIAAKCAPRPAEPVVERFVPCVRCGEPVEEARKCYALPKCYACQPPAEPLPVARPVPVLPAAPGTVFEWRVDAADEWHRETVTAVKIETDRHGGGDWWGDPAAWDKAARTGKLRIVGAGAAAVAQPERAIDNARAVLDGGK